MRNSHGRKRRLGSDSAHFWPSKVFGHLVGKTNFDNDMGPTKHEKTEIASPCDGFFHWPYKVRQLFIEFCLSQGFEESNPTSNCETLIKWSEDYRPVEVYHHNHHNVYINSYVNQQGK